MKQIQWIIGLALVLSTQVAKAEEMVVTAEFDHGYWLVVQGCQAHWQHAAGKRDIQRASARGCMGEENVRVFVDRNPRLRHYEQPRIDQIQYPDRYNNYTLRALVVEPAGGSQRVTVRITSNDRRNDRRDDRRDDRRNDRRNDRRDDDDRRRRP